MKSALILAGFLASCGAQAEATFPKVAPAIQAARDDDRRMILDQERQAEEKALQAAEKALGAAGPDADKKVLSDAVQRHTKNLAALDAEIERMGGTGKRGSDHSAPVRLKAASAAAVTAATQTKDAPYWDVYKREQSWRAK